MKHHPIFLPTLLCCLPLAAQDPGQDLAKLAFARAFELESGAGKAAAARDAYLQAAAAKGSDETRAQALLRAANLQRRLGDRGAATQTLQRLIRSFPQQARTLGEARILLAELQQIASRRLQSDWYRNIQLSASEQAELRGSVREYMILTIPRNARTNRKHASHARLAALERQILLYGRSAVPQLMEAARAGSFADDSLILERSTGLLLKLGVLPPLQALLKTDKWARETSAWTTLLHLSGAERGTLRTELANSRGHLAGLLRQLAVSPAALVAHLQQSDDGALLARSDYRALSALFQAVIADRDREALAAIFRLADDRTTPKVVRERAQWSIVRAGATSQTAARWLSWAKNRSPGETQNEALGHAAEQLRSGDGAILDGILDLLDKLHPLARNDAQLSVHNGLTSNVRPDSMPWNPQRLRRLLFQPCRNVDDLNQVVGVFWTQANGRASLARIIFASPSALLTRFPEDKNSIADFFRYDLDGPQRITIEQDWGRQLLQVIRASWQNWTPAQRRDALILICRPGLLSDDLDMPEGLRGFVVEATRSAPLAKTATACLTQLDGRFKKDD